MKNYKIEGHGDLARDPETNSIVNVNSSDYEQHQTCGSLFQCGNLKCIDPDLMCDGIDHCEDQSDEAAFHGARCGHHAGRYQT